MGMQCVRCVGACEWIWKHRIILHITDGGVRHRETVILSHETSQFFGPSPRKQRLTVYRGLQVLFQCLAGFDNVCTICHNVGSEGKR